MMVSLKGLPDEPRGTAWPPPARVVRCPAKPGNERDLYHYLQMADLSGPSTVARLPW